MMKEAAPERQAQIIAVARDVFLREGFAATSMSQVAAASGGSKATLYHYFPSKQDLFFAVVLAESARSLDHLFEGATLGPDLEADLTALVTRFLQLILSDDLIKLFRLITAESGRFPEIGRLAYETSFGRGLARVAALIGEAMARGDLKRDDPRAAAELLLNLAMGNLHLRRLWQAKPALTEAEIAVAAAQVSGRFVRLYALKDKP